MQPQTDEQRGKTSLRPDSQMIHQQSHERTRGWSSAKVPQIVERTGLQP